jgi:hypothetical protein
VGALVLNRRHLPLASSRDQSVTYRRWPRAGPVAADRPAPTTRLRP